MASSVLFSGKIRKNDTRMKRVNTDFSALFHNIRVFRVLLLKNLLQQPIISKTIKTLIAHYNVIIYFYIKILCSFFYFSGECFISPAWFQTS